MPRQPQPRSADLLSLVAPHSLDDYFDELASWLRLEGIAEQERLALRRSLRSRREVERTGETLIELQLVGHQTGLAGRLLLDFAKANSASLPMTRLKVGSPVIISNDDDPADKGISGVVSGRDPSRLQIATQAWPAGDRFRIDLSPDESTRRRQLGAMRQVRLAEGSTAKLRDRLLGRLPLRWNPLAEFHARSALNASQQDAVRFALAAQDVAVLHGPPGTGKTTTLAEVIYQCVRQGQRVLACASSNAAVDNLMEKLIDLVPEVLRIGHPARVFAALRSHTLDARVDADPATNVVRNMRRELEGRLREVAGVKRGYHARQRRQELFAEIGQLRDQIRGVERGVIRYLLESAPVICSTTTIDEELLHRQAFDVAVIDEACQCTLPGVWQAVLHAPKLIFAGDHCQLPPTVLSDEAARRGMRESMMQQLIQREGETVFRRLTVQYRMHQTIMGFSSAEFYDNSLVADPTVASRRLCDLPDVRDAPWTNVVLEFIDTAGAGLEEEMEPNGQSKLNRGEAEVVAKLIARLKAVGVRKHQIAVIAPYAAQVRLIRDLVGEPGIRIDTVDGFQGQENEVVILSMVRCNDRGEIGFLSDIRRTNVAITRAKRRLVVVGDSATLGHHPFYLRMLEYFEGNGDYQSVWQWQ